MLLLTSFSNVDMGDKILIYISPLMTFEEILKLCAKDPELSSKCMASMLPLGSIAKIVLFSIIGLDSVENIASKKGMDVETIVNKMMKRNIQLVKEII